MLSVGQAGEKQAVGYLQNKGYSILDTNFRTRFGEIDIICRIKDTIIFVEVKTRTTPIKGKPYEAVTFRKLQHLSYAINYYLTQKKMYNLKHRLDVISIVGPNGQKKFDLQHFEDVAFERG